MSWFWCVFQDRFRGQILRFWIRETSLFVYSDIISAFLIAFTLHRSYLWIEFLKNIISPNNLHFNFRHPFRWIFHCLLSIIFAWRLSSSSRWWSWTHNEIQMAPSLFKDAHHWIFSKLRCHRIRTLNYSDLWILIWSHIFFFYLALHLTFYFTLSKQDMKIKQKGL